MTTSVFFAESDGYSTFLYKLEAYNCHCLPFALKQIAALYLPSCIDWGFLCLLIKSTTMNRLLLCLGALLLPTTTIFGQKRPTCHAMHVLERQLEQSPERGKRLQQIEDFTQGVIQQMPVNSDVITIPVVVHILYNQAEENISLAQIQSQLKVLNEDFRRTNPDKNNTPPIFQNIAADAQIEFCLANVDPNGYETSGITRTYTSRTEFQTDDAMMFAQTGGKDAWPSSDYLNIWVCNLSGAVLGYAQFPGGNAATDGVVVDYSFFGTIGTVAAPFEGGRTATHEVGHWLNLRHVWGDGSCIVDDRVDDTPLSGQPNYEGSPCSFPGVNSCSEIVNDQPDMFQNFMDYADDVCMNLFTLGQKSRMRALFEPGGERYSLLSSNGCKGNGLAASCSDGLQNGDEAFVDCGGSNCQPCASGCTHPLGANFAADALLEDGSCNFNWTVCQPQELSYCYQNNEDLVVTFCPEVAAESVALTLESGYVEYFYDRFRLYDNDTASGSTLINTTGMLPTGTYQATNASGCLTLRLTSDASINCLSENFAPLQFTVQCSNPPALPVELIDFSGKVKPEANVLSWISGSEKNVATYLVERRSGDSMTNFQPVGSVQAAGFSSSPQSYSWTDEVPLPEAYYRLRMKDADGSENVSSIVYLKRVDGLSPKTVQLFPNPVRTELSLRYSADYPGAAKVRLTNAGGQVVLTREAFLRKGENVLNLDVRLLPKGIYWLQLQTAQAFFTEKVVVH